MNKNNLIYKYAETLFSLSLKENLVKEYLEEVNDINKIISNEVIKFLSNRFVSFEEKEKICKKLFTSKHNYINIFFTLLVKNNDFFKVKKIINQYILLASSYINISSGIIFSTVELSQNEIKKIEQIFSKKLDKQVTFKNVIDKSLIGGIKIVIDNKVFDKTIKRQQETLKRSLLSEVNK